MAIMMIASVYSYAQVPNEMMYQVMVLDKTTSQIKSNQEVTIKIELRQGATDGQVVWSDEYKKTTNKSGICNLTLAFAEDIDWDKGPNYLAVLIDGEELGTPQITSVPYALKAKNVEGVLTMNELLGTWKGTCVEPYDGSFTETYTFNNDGTLHYTYTDTRGKGDDDYTVPYYYKNTGEVAIKSDYESRWKMCHIFKISENEIILGQKDGIVLKKQ